MRMLKDADREMAKITSENISFLCDLKNSRRDKPKAKIAELCGVDPSAVTKWTDGRIVPSVVSLLVIAKYFGVSLEWLVTKHDFSRIDVAKLVSDATTKGE